MLQIYLNQFGLLKRKKGYNAPDDDDPFDDGDDDHEYDGPMA